MSNEYSDSSSEVLKSKYNSAVSQLYRLDDLWKDAHKQAREINYTKYNETLDRIWLELIADSGDDQKIKMGIINEKLDDLSLYSLTTKLKKLNIALFAKLVNLQKQILMQKEEILREIQNKQGKGSAYEDEIADYMD